MGAIDKKIGKMFLKILKPIINPIMTMFMYMKCVLKLTVNFPKCFIFYWLDIIKYTLFYLPILILMGMVGLAKEWIPIQKTLDKYIGWSNDTQNSCYRCKNKKGKSFFDKIKDMMKKKQAKGESAFSFFSFLMICLIGGAFGYTFWFSFLKK